MKMMTPTIKHFRYNSGFLTGITEIPIGDRTIEIYLNIHNGLNYCVYWGDTGQVIRERIMPADVFNIIENLLRESETVLKPELTVKEKLLDLLSTVKEGIIDDKSDLINESPGFGIIDLVNSEDSILFPEVRTRFFFTKDRLESVGPVTSPIVNN